MTTIISTVDVLSLNSEDISKNEVPKKKSKGHRCYFCGQRFLEKNVLRRHISVHKDRDFICDVCGKGFSYNWCLRKHMRVHTGERPFLCEHCGKGFSQKSTMDFHIRAMHGNRADLQCKSCGKKLRSFSYEQCWLCRYGGKKIKEDCQQISENTDQMQSNNRPGNSESCSSLYISDKKREVITELKSGSINSNVPTTDHVDCRPFIISPSFSELKTQIFKDSNFVKVLVCFHCGLKLTGSISMQAHLLTHPNLKPFLCQNCGKDFKTTCALKQHKSLHKKDRPYLCKTCGKTFTLSRNLQRHFRVHTGERPFQCKFCEKRFSQSNSLKAHLLIHQPLEAPIKKAYMCNVCGKKFKSFSNFKQHMLQHNEFYENTPKL